MGVSQRLPLCSLCHALPDEVVSPLLFASLLLVCLPAQRNKKSMVNKLPHTETSAMKKGAHPRNHVSRLFPVIGHREIMKLLERECKSMAAA